MPSTATTLSRPSGPQQLPFDVDKMYLQVSTRRWLDQYGHDEARHVTDWWVTIAMERWVDDKRETIPVGEIHLVSLDVCSADASGVSLIEELDIEGGDPYHAACAILEDGQVAQDLQERLAGYAGRVLLLNTVILEPQFRGYGLGPLLAAEALNLCGPDHDLYICYPSPLQDGESPPLDPEAVKAATAKLAKVWKTLKFHPFRDGYFYADPCLAEGEAARRRQRARFGLHR